MPTDYTKFYIKNPIVYTNSNDEKVEIKITDDIPNPQNWPDADFVFVLNPPPLDIPAVAPILDGKRKLILAGTQSHGDVNKEKWPPFNEFWEVKNLGDKLERLRDKDTCVFYMQSRKRTLFDGFWPRDTRERIIIDSKHFVYYIEDYIAHNDSFLFDDTYRRLNLRDYTLEQSTCQFLYVLESLPHTVQSGKTKASIFRDNFPFYKGRQLVNRNLRFKFDKFEGDLVQVREAVIGDLIKQNTVEYALAIASLSEIAAGFNHPGRHDLYSELMGDLIQIDKEGNITIQDLNEESREILRKQDPVLYLHLLYRNPNQFLIARFDGMKDLKLGINALEKLEHRVVLYDEDLKFIKRTHEIVALNGTLCQFKTFAARIFNNPD